MLSAQKITPEGLKQLGRFRKLEFLRVNRTSHGDAMLAGLARHPALNKLMVAGSTGITSSGLQHLSTASSLRSLDITDVQLDLAALASLPKQLERLAITRCQIGDAGVAAFPAFPKLNYISLKDDEQITSAGLIALIKRYRHLEGVAVDGTNDQFLESLSELPRLKTLYLGGSLITESGWQAIGRLKSLEL